MSLAPVAPPIVLLCGPKGSGKSTLAASLVLCGWFELAFADPLKRFVKQLIPTLPVDVLAGPSAGRDAYRVDLTPLRGNVRRMVIAIDHLFEYELGETGVELGAVLLANQLDRVLAFEPDTITLRRLLQVVGTEWGQEKVDRLLWVKTTERKVLALRDGGPEMAKRLYPVNVSALNGRPPKGIVLSDGRFDHEYEAARSWGATLVLCDPGARPIDLRQSHVSEPEVAALRAKTDCTANTAGPEYGGPPPGELAHLFGVLWEAEDRKRIAAEEHLTGVYKPSAFGEQLIGRVCNKCGSFYKLGHEPPKGRCCGAPCMNSGCNNPVNNPWSVCHGCSPIPSARHEAETFLKATALAHDAEAASAPVYIPSQLRQGALANEGSMGEGFYASLAELRDYCADLKAPLPPYVYPCDQKRPEDEVDADRYIEEALAEHHSEAAAHIGPGQREVLGDYLKDWWKQTGVCTWTPDRSRVFILDPERCPKPASHVAPAGAP